MTASEMHENTIVQFEKINSNAAPGISDAEMSIILSNAQLYYVQSRLNPILNTTKQGLEETEVRMQGLSVLINSASITSFNTTSVNLPNGVFADLPQDFMYTILESVIIDKENCITKTPAYIPVYVLSHNDVIRESANPFKRPYFNGYEGLVWRLAYSRNTTGYNDQNAVSLDPNTGYYNLTGISDKRHELITDGTFTVVEYFIRYLKIPRQIISTFNGDGSTSVQVNCELDEQTQQAIISIAVSMLKDSLLQPSQKSSPDMQQIE